VQRRKKISERDETEQFPSDRTVDRALLYSAPNAGTDEKGPGWAALQGDR
jgi:hypothetical protein